MNPLLLSGIFDIGKSLIERWFPDPEKAREAEQEMFKLAMDGELKQLMGQLEINAREAQNPSIFVSGWRPFFGWTAGIGFVYATIGQPVLVWLSAKNGWPVPPEINVDLLWVVATGMLGIGGMRSFEKRAGVATK